MSGALEVAASAFAVVGVADVLVRTGREFYSFLGEVADAPEEIDRLREVIRTTVLLYHNSRRCQQDLKTRGASASAADVTSSLESATKALDRELRELSKTAKKYNGIKTWGNIKFVLGKDRVNKAIQRLEHAKTLMANALTLACIELLALGLTDVKTVMLKCFEDAGLKTDRVYQALVAKIDAQHQDALVLHNHQKALTSKIDNNQRNQLLNQDRHQRTLITTQRTQVEILRRQDASMRVAKGTQQQTSSILRAVTDIKQLLSLNDGSLLVDQSHRAISFLGERQDRIMAYLLPFQDDIEFAIDSLISQHGHEISASDAEFLRSELQHLVGSAAQEKALQHPGSAAKSFDRWSYPQDTVGFLKNSAKNRTSSGYSYSTDGEKITSTRQMTGSGKRWALSSRTFNVQTPSGPVDITMPRSREAGEDIHETAEAGISYVVTQNHSSVHVNAHFLRDLAHAGQPRIYAHLNVFTVVDEATTDRYHSGICNSTSLAKFDTALRQGIISPFHVDKYGNNLCLLVSSFSSSVV
ncbi:hypothetical protein SNOG_15040 [Parastagonospora nodorum SN15]|uniref:Fungal N-terminal domain-containing protein n=1 Tax=Phaeosphaeria nodorum (strain SN15 / ATCC MYA-4574 / FGSC 10173) TaxID=321614 RepID=Q0TZM2_PHANO|nr:hypothetical protein SNOG_15040 [Parastagonospora nodorum SN15]EAT77583.2 hypothetical protein SNOG_15040 [Parastagonospora nodorum SN15]